MGNSNPKKTMKFHGHLDSQNNNTTNNMSSHNAFNQTEYKKTENELKTLNTLTNIIIIIIPLNSGQWEKSYNAQESLSQIPIDFKRENSIPENIKIDFIYKNKILNMDATKIDSLIENNSKEITIYHQITDPNYVIINEDTTNFFAKPFYSPFELIILNKKNKNFISYSFDEDTIQEKLLYKCNKTSSYCNGNNYLFISGGVDSQHKPIKIFWSINLENFDVIENSNQMPGMKNHSMIYIKVNNNQRVYMIGGGNTKTYYDINTKGINEYNKLSKTRIESALIISKLSTNF